ncbi:hypothetical protein BDM02DRAFT_2327375 [Thelephora ganbajun]|uniref:Uncharacterized protein n=1 Tax=Thelephora ganbajun TaxID=370292 RepID=A0ACB6YY20_THEGA|nr:hypothetical protein BDM02DRAFT_2327375 [Thelephora ganbajun]
MSPVSFSVLFVRIRSCQQCNLTPVANLASLYLLSSRRCCSIPHVVRISSWLQNDRPLFRKGPAIGRRSKFCDKRFSQLAIPSSVRLTPGSNIFVYMSWYKQKILSYFSKKRSIILQPPVKMDNWVTR